MKLGVIFPQTEFGNDVGALKEYAQAAEALGYSHIGIFDHVLGASRRTRPDWTGPYDLQTPFHEPFVLFGFWAALTRRMEFHTCVLILPQRQTVLVAKQAAEVDVLTGGRLRLGVGIGWNAVEYEALGEDFRTRGRREEEQIALLRELWTKGEVTFQGQYHTVNAAGLNPLPVQRPIPIWLGGSADLVLRRAARIADGWLPQVQPDEQGRAAVERFRRYVREAGRDPARVGVAVRLSPSNVPQERWAETVRTWRDLGATDLSFNTMRLGFRTPREHIDLMRKFKAVADQALL